MSFLKKTVPYHVYIDFDDVLSETAKLLLKVTNSEFGRNLAFEDIYSFNIGKTFGLTAQEVEHVMSIMHKPENLLSITPIKQAAETVQNWTKYGITIDVVTGRPPFTEDASRTWLEKHNIPYSKLIFVNKYARNYDGFKHHDDAITLDELKKYQYDLAIDDSETMLQFLFTEMNMNIALFHRPWNADLKIPDTENSSRKIKRCHNWQEINSTFLHIFIPSRGNEI
jgi:uncharacterized HAD superfamily protein